MLRENQLKNMKVQNEILNQNIHLNDDKKELFELNNNNNDSKNMNKLLSNVIYKSIAKNRRGYLFKDLSTNTKKAFDGYISENPEILDLNKVNNNNENITNYENGNGNNINNNGKNNSKRMLNINFNIYQNKNQ